MAVVDVVEGLITLPEEVRALLSLLPRDPLVMTPEGDHVVLSRATPPPGGRGSATARPRAGAPLAARSGHRGLTVRHSGNGGEGALPPLPAAVVSGLGQDGEEERAEHDDVHGGAPEADAAHDDELEVDEVDDGGGAD